MEGNNIFFTRSEICYNIEVIAYDCADIDKFQYRDFIDTGLFLIEGISEDFARKVLSRIRQSPVPAIYLKPTIILEPGDHISKELQSACDGSMSVRRFNGVYFQQLQDIIERINRKTAFLDNADKESDTNLVFKILRYLYSRATELVPMKSTATIYGFTYPDVEIFFSRPDKEIFHSFDFLESQRLFSSTFYDRAYFCSSCHSAFLNFKEICTRCESPNLRTDDLIHHFHCGYVGPFDDFNREGKLVCPKCDRAVKHIGTDHDKPSIVFNCNDCGNSFQNPNIITDCYNCGKLTKPEEQIMRTIKKYSITPLAENASIHGMDSLFIKALEKEIELLPYDFFKKFLNIEIKRIKRYKNFTSALCLLSIKELDKVYMEAGDRAKQIFDELSSAIKALLRTSDVITSLSESDFLIILTETEEEGAETGLDRLRSRIKNLLDNNLEQIHEVHISFRMIEDSMELDSEGLIADITEDL